MDRIILHIDVIMLFLVGLLYICLKKDINMILEIDMLL